MRAASSSRACTGPRQSGIRPRQRGIALIVTCILVPAIVPAVGLALDVGVMYSIKTRLSAAVDSAALAGARSLSRGGDPTAQALSASNTATAMVKANYPTGYMGSYNLTVDSPSIDNSVAYRRSITVNARVTTPVMFMRWLTGTASTTVSASAKVTRRDVNIMIVQDRSGSLENSGSCGAVKAAATDFVGRFAQGRDYMGLITFATSSNEDDFALTQDFGTMTNVINSVTCTGGTNSSQALWQAYRKLVNLNQPGALNAIVFFTDGQPTALTANFNILSSSTCSVKTPHLAVFQPGFDGSGNAVATMGLWNPVAPAQPMSSDNNIDSQSSGCYYASYWAYGTAAYVRYDVTGIPTLDAYGNSTDGNSSASPYASVQRTGGVGSELRADDPLTAQNAAINAADDAALRIRHGAAVPELGNRSLSGVVIYTIGLGTGVPTDFMQRVANTRSPQASNYESAYPSGLYAYAATAGDLQRAFRQVASEITRIAQ